MESTFYSYAHPKGFGYIVLEASPPKTGEDIKIATSLIAKHCGHKPDDVVILSWQVLDE